MNNDVDKKNSLNNSNSFENKMKKAKSKSKNISDNNKLLNQIIRSHSKKNRNFFEKFKIYRTNLIKKYAFNSSKNINYNVINSNNNNIKVFNKNNDRLSHKKNFNNRENKIKNYNMNNQINLKNPLIIKVDLTKLEQNNNKSHNLINHKKAQNEPFKSYAFVEYPNKEHRDSMEDYHSFQNLSFDNYIFYYFSIFDGHNGSQISLYLKNNFHIILLSQLKKIEFNKASDINKEKIISALKISFNQIDKDIINNKNIKNDIGSTGTVLLLYREPYDIDKINIICCNVGDSSGYIVNKEKMYKITEEHNCKNINEVERIKKSGGLIFRNRVFGALIITRSFGNKDMKQYGVISTPYCFHSLINKNDLYAIVCSDGVWNVCTEDEIYQLSKEYLSSENLSKKIVKLSIDKGTTDNVSCLVIKLNIAN
jgi:serine/threonine protein phosphatase PrpC